MPKILASVFRVTSKSSCLDVMLSANTVDRHEVHTQGAIVPQVSSLLMAIHYVVMKALTSLEGGAN